MQVSYQPSPPLPTPAHYYCLPLPPLPTHSVADPNTFQIFYLKRNLNFSLGFVKSLTIHRLKYSKRVLLFYPGVLT